MEGEITNEYATNYDKERRGLVRLIAEDKKVLEDKPESPDTEMIDARLRKNERALEGLGRKHNLGGNLDADPEIRALKQTIVEDSEFLNEIGKDPSKKPDENQRAAQVIGARLRRNTKRLLKLTSPKEKEAA